MALATRRDLFKAVGVLGAAGVVSATLEAAPAEAAGGARPGRDFVTGSLDLHLLRRTTYGPTPAMVDAVRRLGRSDWLDQQLHPSQIDDSACQKMIKDKFPRLFWSIPKVMNSVPEGDHWPFMIELSMATIGRAIWSKRQLFEMMSEFWDNHLNVTCPTDKVWFARHDYETNVIRKHALGRFEDMLIASAYHPAMLTYLNNAESSKIEPNENYGRELLELHTVGFDGGYNEREMYDSSLIMTGFTINAGNGLFTYNGSLHHTGPVQVMGFSDPNPTGNGGEDVAVRYLKYLANHPATARHIAYKLCRRFVSDDPDSGLVDSLAQTYLYHETAIVPVLRQLFESAEFNAAIGKKIRRPLEDIVATARILGYRPEPKGTVGLRGLHWMCSEIGQAPMAWDLPDGYPDDAISWLSGGSTLNRWNRHYSMAGHWAAKTLPQPPLRDLLPRKVPKNYGAMLDALAKSLVFRTMEDRHKKVILDFLDRKASDPFDGKDANSTSKMAKIVALILDSPYFGVR